MIGGGAGVVGLLVFWLFGMSFLGALFVGILIGAVVGIGYWWTQCKPAESGTYGHGDAPRSATRSDTTEPLAAGAAMGASPMAATAATPTAGSGDMTPDDGPASSPPASATTMPKVERDRDLGRTATETDKGDDFGTDPVRDGIEAAKTADAAPAEVTPVPDDVDPMPEQGDAAASPTRDPVPAGDTDASADPAPVVVETAPEPKAEPAPDAPALSPQDGGTQPSSLDAPRDGGPDDLKLIKGVGPKLESVLHEHGIYHFDQIAGWGAEEVAWMDGNLTGFRGRVSRDDWVDQATVLASGGETEFSTRSKGAE